MIKKVLKKIEKLKNDKSKLVIIQTDLQKKIDNIDIELKEYSNLKKDYEKLEKKYNDLTLEEKNNE